MRSQFAGLNNTTSVWRARVEHALFDYIIQFLRIGAAQVSHKYRDVTGLVICLIKRILWCYFYHRSIFIRLSLELWYIFPFYVNDITDGGQLLVFIVRLHDVDFDRNNYYLDEILKYKRRRRYLYYMYLLFNNL